MAARCRSPPSRSAVSKDSDDVGKPGASPERSRPLDPGHRRARDPRGARRGDAPLSKWSPAALGAAGPTDPRGPGNRDSGLGGLRVVSRPPARARAHPIDCRRHRADRRAIRRQQRRASVARLFHSGGGDLPRAPVGPPGRAKRAVVVSVCKPFFLGQIDGDLLFPYPTMAPDEAETLSLLLDSLERFAEERIDSRAIDREGRIPREVIDGLGEMGILGIVVPEEYGGAGGSAAFYARVTEALAAIDGSIVVTVGAHQSIGFKGILIFGTEEQKRRFLPSLATGEKLAAFALTEPGAGSDAASIRTRA